MIAGGKENGYPQTEKGGGSEGGARVALVNTKIMVQSPSANADI